MSSRRRWFPSRSTVTFVCLVVMPGVLCKVACSAELQIESYEAYSTAKRAINLVGVKSSIKDPIVAILDAERSAPSGGPQPGHPIKWADFIAALRNWLAATSKLDRTGHAAGLLTADMITSLREYAVSPPRSDVGKTDYEFAKARAKPKAISDLELLGAKYVYDELGGLYVSEGRWTLEAWRIDGTGPAGSLAFLLLMRCGFDLTGICDSGGAEFRKVIAEGRKFLKQSTDAEINAKVHFMIGDAYRDIVIFGSNPANPEDEMPAPEQYRSEVKTALVQAIRHYREGLRLDRDSDEAHGAESALAALLAGKTPPRTEIRYYCVYD